MGAITPRNFKFVSRSVAADESALCWVRFNADRSPVPQTDAAADITAATVEVTANDLTFLVNGGAETVIGTYTGNSGADNTATFGDTNCATIAELIAVINGVAPGQSSVIRRWRAGLGDFRPQFAIGTGDGLATAAANAMLGRGHEGLACLADTSALAAVTISIGLGEPRCRAGGGQTIPDHFDTGYSSTTAGGRTPVHSPALDTENQPGQANFQVFVTDIQQAASFATTQLVTAYDNAGNTLKVETITAGTVGNTIAGSGEFSIDNPWVVGPPGSPVWIEITGTGGLTDGTCTVSGYIRTA